MFENKTRIALISSINKLLDIEMESLELEWFEYAALYWRQKDRVEMKKRQKTLENKRINTKYNKKVLNNLSTFFSVS
jgi:hypothetical protein